jgi:hypothetical protein
MINKIETEQDVNNHNTKHFDIAGFRTYNMEIIPNNIELNVISEFHKEYCTLKNLSKII